MTDLGQFLTRRNCHFCESDRPSLLDATARLGLGIAEFDVDEDPQLRGRFPDRVPVVLCRAPVMAEGRTEGTRLGSSPEAPLERPSGPLPIR